FRGSRCRISRRKSSCLPALFRVLQFSESRSYHIHPSSSAKSRSALSVRRAPYSSMTSTSVKVPHVRIEILLPIQHQDFLHHRHPVSRSAIRSLAVHNDV